MAGIQPPTLSFAERDRRWQRTRDLMRQHDLEGLLIAGFRTPKCSRAMPATITTRAASFSRWKATRSSSPGRICACCARCGRRARPEALDRGYARRDQRRGRRRDRRREKFDDAKLGVVGLTSQAPTETWGGIPATFWAQFSTALPKASFADISEEFSYMMLVKSQEELAQVRYAAKAAESACKAVAEVAGPGVGEEVSWPRRRPRCCASASACAIR